MNSKYYDSNVCRFISSDGLLGPVGDIIGHNVYTYAANNPINKTDSNGDFPHVLAGAIVGFVAGAAVNLVIQAVSGEKVDWGEVAIESVSGAVYGALVCLGVGAIALAASKVTLAGATALAHGLYNGDDTEEIVSSVKTSMAISGIIQVSILSLPSSSTTNSLMSNGISKLNDYATIVWIRAVRGIGSALGASVNEEGE